LARFPQRGGKLSRVANADSVAVIGLGRFGQSLALELMRGGAEVLGIDSDEQIVQALNGKLTHVVRADSTDEEVLRSLSVPDFDRVVVAIGSDIQASILTTSQLLRLGIPQLWAKAVSDQHGLILEQLGVKHVVYPEKEMGRRVAHLVRGAMLDYVDIGDDFALVTTPASEAVIGEPLGVVKARDRFGVTVNAYKRDGSPWQYATADTVLQAGDKLLVGGRPQAVEEFSQLR
jgi:trk system potassium uptake protein